jgi:hypothetical protein
MPSGSKNCFPEMRINLRYLVQRSAWHNSEQVYAIWLKKLLSRTENKFILSGSKTALQYPKELYAVWLKKLFQTLKRNLCHLVQKSAFQN